MKNKILVFLLIINVFFPTFVSAETETENIDKSGGRFESTMEKIKPYINTGETISVNGGRNGNIYSGGFKFVVGFEEDDNRKSSSHER